MAGKTTAPQRDDTARRRSGSAAQTARPRQPADRRLAAEDIRVAVPGRLLVEGLDVAFAPGELVAVLGQNGAGKTLTLHTLAGLRDPAAGRVLLGGQGLAAWSRRRLAQELALLPQDSDDVFPATVFETVLIGRHPHVGTLRLESARDRDIAARALTSMGLAAMRDRDVTSLSGGERRRLAIAQVLTQAPRFYLLDEPLNHLDPQHQLEVLQLFRRLADDGACVVASLHDVNLARRYADRVLMLFGDGSWEAGDADRVLGTESLGRLYDVQMEAVRWRGVELYVAAGGPPREPG